MTRTAQQARLLKAAMADVWKPELPDEHGNQRWREADLAAQHLATLTPERRAYLEQEWDA